MKKKWPPFGSHFCLIEVVMAALLDNNDLFSAMVAPAIVVAARPSLVKTTVIVAVAVNTTVMVAVDA